MRQQFVNAAVQIRRQPGGHILEVSPQVMPIELGRLHQVHHHSRTLPGELTARLNRYAYANNNPYRFVDPTGFEPFHQDENTFNGANGPGWTSSFIRAVSYVLGRPMVGSSAAMPPVAGLISGLRGFGVPAGLLTYSSDLAPGTLTPQQRAERDAAGAGSAEGDRDDQAAQEGGSRRPSADPRRRADEAATDENGDLRCQYCGTKLTDKVGSGNSREYDHVNPWSRGGDSSPGNIVDSCRTCNRSKGPRTPGEWGGR